MQLGITFILAPAIVVFQFFALTELAQPQQSLPHLAAPSRDDTPRNRAGGVVPRARAPAPGSSADPEWLERLRNNPDDLELWDIELNRQKELYGVLASRRLQSPRNSSLAFAEARNLQLQGIALRHLKRYEDSLKLLSQSTDALAAIEEWGGCLSARRGSTCDQIIEERMFNASYFASVYMFLNNHSSVEQYLKQAMSLARSESDYRKYLRLLVFWLFDNNDWESAVRVVFDELDAALSSKRRMKVEIASSTATSLYSRFLKAISWDPTTHKRLTGDPRDFADNSGLGIGRKFKYGMTDPDEDSATMAGALASQDVSVVAAYVRHEIADNHFEFAAKYLFFSYIYFGFDVSEDFTFRCRVTGPEVSFEEIVSKMEEVPAITLSANTRRTIEMFILGAEFIAKHCK